MKTCGSGVFAIRMVVLATLDFVGCDGPTVLPTRANPLYCDERTPCPGRTHGSEMTICDVARHQCIAATADLAMSPDMAMPECLASMASTDCPAERPICEREHCRACVQITDDDACRRRAPGTPRCGSGGTCVACRAESQDADCGRASPICRDGVCGRCTGHSECATGACAGDGSCESADRIFSVDNGGKTAADCHAAGVHDGLSRGTAFCDVQSALAAAAPRPIVVIRGGGQEAFTVVSGTVKIIGPGAFDGFLMGEHTLRGTAMGTAAITFTPVSPAQVTIEDLRFQGGIGAPGILCQSLVAPARLIVRNSFVEGGLGNDGHGMKLSYGCTATVEDTQVHQSRDGVWCYGCNASITRSTIARNSRGVVLDDAHLFGQTIPGSLSIDASTVEKNSDTGITCQSGGECAITNSLIAANGTLQMGLGGIVLAGSVRATVDLDTIVGNLSPGAPAGVNCLSSSPSTVANSIVWGNSRGAGSQLGSRCIPSQVVTGAGDIMGTPRDPVFVGPQDFHLRPADPANGGADGCCVDRGRPPPGATWADHDRDSARRPLGAAHDLGAYERE